MEEILRNLIEGATGGFAYGLVVAILIACGMGVPLPEDVSLILGGFLVYEGNAQLAPMMAAGLLGIIVGDSLIFSLGRRMGSRVGAGPPGLIRRIVTPEKLARVETLFQKHGEKIVFIARFLPGVRAVVYFTAGSARMKYWHFLAFDGIAALVSAPLWVWLGYRFGGELEELIRKVRSGQKGVFLAMGAVLIGYIAFRAIKARRAARKKPLDV